MKKFLSITLLFLLLVITSFGQRFTLNELIKLNTKNWDDFDTYVTTKGYEYHATDTSNSNEAKAYALETNYSTGKASYFISKAYYKDQKQKAVAFQTTNKNDYLSFKNELKAAGFSYVKSQVTDLATFLDYKKGNIELSLASFKSPNGSSEMITGYEISVITSSN